MVVKKEVEIHVPTLLMEQLELVLIGTTGLLLNRMSQKSEGSLITGGHRKTTAEKAATAKHEPLNEYRAAMYVLPNGPAALGFPCASVKKSMVVATADMGSIAGTQAKRLIRVEGELTPLYGIPKIRCDVVRLDNPKRTPDIRTRPFLEQWALPLKLSFMRPNLTARAVITLLSNAGMLCGIGDYRQEKGAASFGSFRVAQPNDLEYQELVDKAGRVAQLEAIESPERAGPETAVLLDHWQEWYDARELAI